MNRIMTAVTSVLGDLVDGAVWLVGVASFLAGAWLLLTGLDRLSILIERLGVADPVLPLALGFALLCLAKKCDTRNSQKPPPVR